MARAHGPRAQRAALGQALLRRRVLRIRSLRLRTWIASVRRLRASLRLRRLRRREVEFIDSPYGGGRFWVAGAAAALIEATGAFTGAASAVGGSAAAWAADAPGTDAATG